MLERSKAYQKRCKEVCTDAEYDMLEKAFFDKENNLRKQYRCIEVQKSLNEGKSRMVGIYFSGTGNSRYAAEFFCNEYDETAKAFSIEDAKVIDAVKNDEMLVFAYPV